MLLEIEQVVKALQKKGIEFERRPNLLSEKLRFITELGKDIVLRFDKDKKISSAIELKFGAIDSVKNFFVPEM